MLFVERRWPSPDRLSHSERAHRDLAGAVADRLRVVTRSTDSRDRAEGELCFPALEISRPGVGAFVSRGGSLRWGEVRTRRCRAPSGDQECVQRVPLVVGHPLDLGVEAGRKPDMDHLGVAVAGHRPLKLRAGTSVNRQTAAPAHPSDSRPHRETHRHPTTRSSTRLPRRRTEGPDDDAQSRRAATQTAFAAGLA
jgi:hypothetical protein